MLDRRLASQLAQARVELEAYKPTTPAGRRNYAFVGPRRPYQNPAEMYQDLADVWRQSSLQMYRLCTASGIRYFHFLQPNQYRESSKPMSTSERRAAIRPGSGYERDVRAGYPLLLEAGRDLAAQGVAFTDLTQVFAGSSKPLYTDNCCHFSEEGNRILGHAIGRSMVATIEQYRREEKAAAKTNPRP